MSLPPEILPLENVLCDLEVTSATQLFELVSRLFEANQKIPRRTIEEGLRERERLGSTGLGSGVAIPHGRIKGLSEAHGAFVKLRVPIAFDAPDARPVSLFFILLVPGAASELHLQILGELAQLFADRRLREQLQASTDPAEMRRLLTS